MMIKIPRIKVDRVAPILDLPGAFMVRVKHPYFTSKSYGPMEDKTWAIAGLIRTAVQKVLDKKGGNTCPTHSDRVKKRKGSI
jgi:hypothetical protein